MTNARFKEIVSLFLDREISPRDLESLRSELENPQRKREFEEYRRLHQAEKRAMSLLFGATDDAARVKRSISRRACDAISEARVRFEERRKGLVLVGQFTVATAAIAITVGFLYRDSVRAFDVKENQWNTQLGPNQLAGIQLNPLNGSEGASLRLILNGDGQPASLVTVDTWEANDLQVAPVVSESSLFRLGSALEALKPKFPQPTALLDAEIDEPSVRELPGTSAPIVFVQEDEGSGKIVGFAY